MSTRTLLRETPLPQVAYLRFREAEENRQHADVARAEREALKLLREEQSAAVIAQGRERVAERLARQNTTRKLREKLIKRRSKEVRKLRDETQAGNEKIAERQNSYREEVRKRVAEQSAFEQRLEAAEAKADAEMRKETAREREEAVREATARNNFFLEKRRAIAKEIREQLGSTAELSGALVSLARQRGQERRDDAKQLSAERSKRDSGYLDKAREGKARAMATRERARAAVAEAAEERRKAAARERSNNYLVHDEKNRILNENKQEVRTIYKARFASREAFHEYEASSWKRLSPAGLSWFVSPKGKDSPGTSRRSSPRPVSETLPDRRVVNEALVNSSVQL